MTNVGIEDTQDKVVVLTNKLISVLVDRAYSLHSPWIYVLQRVGVSG